MYRFIKTNLIVDLVYAHTLALALNHRQPLQKAKTQQLYNYTIILHFQDEAKTRGNVYDLFSGLL